ncbi:unnamed protein product [Heligmosomoides polygyrus]|uniref:EF-hand domain-containing protein n=1 Tax=Heligmosomoides polygyrus TaxID=6339 RepID=A0A183G9Y9_HELPZ|nr:unnamed protein product [Heligmosomoides polygyrus]
MNETDYICIVLTTNVQLPSQGSEISKEEWASTLFGERGVLSGIFQMLDQQRKQTQSPQQDGSGKINSNEFDFKRIMDALLKGADGNSFGDPGPELPEFLGLCNRLSCGDIYKAIDKFRRSEFFSNFQVTFFTLVVGPFGRFKYLLHDPNGWETLGNLLSNPELISQFTAGTGMEELFGSALGQAKKESVKTKEKNSKLTPEDGDFGIEFIDSQEKLPEVDFSVDEKSEVPSGDYYEQVGFVKRLLYGIFRRQIEVDLVPPLPEISFSIDGDGEESEVQTIAKEIDIMMPPSASKRVGHTSTIPPKIQQKLRIDTRFY